MKKKNKSNNKKLYKIYTVSQLCSDIIFLKMIC